MELFESKKSHRIPEQERISEFTVGQCLTNLKYYGQRITDIYSKYEELDQNSDDAAIMLDAIKNNFNEYALAFLDLVLVICDDKVISSLGSAVRAFISKFNPKEPERSFVDFLNERNSVIHEYCGWKFLDERTRILLSNYVDGALGVVRIFEMYVRENNLATIKIRKCKI